MSLLVPDLNFHIIAPALIVAVTAIIVLLGDLVTPHAHKRWLGYTSIVGLVAATIVSIGLWDSNANAFHGMIAADNFGLFLTVTVLIGATISTLLSIDFVDARDVSHGEYYVLLLASVAGMIVMSTATDLIVIFLGLELLSLPLYILAAFYRDDKNSLEAGMKYLLLGAFSSAFFLYGIAFLYGATGSTSLRQMEAVFLLKGENTDLLLIGASLLLVGFAFKVALVPFHWWTPDVYDGAPTTITAFMSVATKAAAFGAFFRAFSLALPAPAFDWRVALSVIAVMTMTLGNITALLQTSIKRMLAYSSIAHAGYILIALIATGERGVSNVLFYLLAYTVTNLGAFGGIIALGNGSHERESVSDLAGAAKDHPLIAAALTICMLSLAGFPPFAGFVGKFLIFSGAVENGRAWLAVVGVLNSLVSAYFYLRPVVEMYMHAPAEGWTNKRISPFVVAALLLCVFGTIMLGLDPSSVLDLAPVAILR
jgi:NADH-quinone oxidoreductase subunit N